MALTDTQRDAWGMVRMGVRSVDREFLALARDIERIVRTAPEPLDATSVMRQIDRRLDRVFGLTQRAALDSGVFRSIVRSTETAAARPYLRALHDLETTIVRRDPLLWERVRPRLLGDVGLGPRVATLPDLDPIKPENWRRMAEIMRQQSAPVRAQRARSFDPQRRWVPRSKWNTKRGYRLSDRVWRQGRVVRRNITMTLKDGIRRGDSAAQIAERLEHYLNPEMAPTRYLKNGRIVRKWTTSTPTGAGHGSVYARTLARTEIMRIHGAATVEASKQVPGVQGVRWRLSHRHAKPDECDDNARNSSEGLPRGVYLPDEVPPYPNHPNCICVLVPEMKPADDVVDEIIAMYGGV